MTNYFQTEYGKVYYRKLKDVVEVVFPELFLAVPNNVQYAEEWFPETKRLDASMFAPTVYNIDKERAKHNIEYRDFYISGQRYVEKAHIFTFPIKGVA